MVRAGSRSEFKGSKRIVRPGVGDVSPVRLWASAWVDAGRLLANQQMTAMGATSPSTRARCRGAVAHFRSLPKPGRIVSVGRRTDVQCPLRPSTGRWPQIIYSLPQRVINEVMVSVCARL